MFEAHHKYIDIHYIIAGKEGISTRSTCELTPVDDFKEIDDIGSFRVCLQAPVICVPVNSWYAGPKMPIG